MQTRYPEVTVPDLHSELHKTISDFVAEISAIARRVAVEALERALGASGESRTVPRIARTARVEKRTESQLEALAGSLHEFVSRHPGLRIEQINKELSTTTKALALPIRHLIAEGAIKTKGARRSTSYFASDRKKTKKN
jgi:hypothetical protein